MILSKSTLIDCVIRDMSDTGVRLEFGGLTQLPSEFKLRVAASGAEAVVELAWQRGLSAGVWFDAPLRVRQRCNKTDAVSAASNRRH